MRLIVASVLAALWSDSGVRQAGALAAGGEDAAVVAARQRQDAVKTIVLEYKRTVIEAAGSRSAELPTKPKVLVPAEETTTESINRLVMDGPMFRHEDNHPGWFHLKQTDRSTVTVFNGAVQKTFFPRGMSGNGNPCGGIERTATPDGLKHAFLTPITFTFRGLNPAMSTYLLTAMKPTGLRAVINGDSCREYLLAEKMLTSSFWLDTSRDHVVRRIDHHRKKQLIYQTDVHYQPDPSSLGGQGAGVWLPASWVHRKYSSTGAILTTTKIDVLQLRLNDALPAELFDIRWPPGTTVVDARVGKEFTVQPDGSLRELSPTLPPPRFEDTWLWRARWKLGFLGVVILGLLFLLLLFRRWERTTSA